MRRIYEEAMIPTCVRLSRRQIEEFRAMGGGAWLRSQIDARLAFEEEPGYRSRDIIDNVK